MLKRAFLGSLRGEPDHCSMVAIPTLAEEDARRPNRERENLVGERTRIINGLKGALARLGIRALTRNCATHENVSRHCARPKAKPFRRTLLPSCSAT